MCELNRKKLVNLAKFIKIVLIRNYDNNLLLYNFKLFFTIT